MTERAKRCGFLLSYTPLAMAWLATLNISIQSFMRNDVVYEGFLLLLLLSNSTPHRPLIEAGDGRISQSSISGSWQSRVQRAERIVCHRRASRGTFLPCCVDRGSSRQTRHCASSLLRHTRKGESESATVALYTFHTIAVIPLTTRSSLLVCVTAWSRDPAPVKSQLGVCYLGHVHAPYRPVASSHPCINAAGTPSCAAITALVNARATGACLSTARNSTTDHSTFA